MRLLALALLLAASVVAASSMSTTAQTDATQLLANAATITSQQTSLHLEIKNERGDTKIVRGVKFKKVEGDVLLPDRLAADVRAEAMFKTLTIQVVLVGDDLWSTDPVIGRFSGFKHRDLDPALIALLAPRNVLLAIPQLVQQPVIDGPEEIDDQLLTKISGTVDFDRLAALTGAQIDALATGQGSLPIQLWLDDQSRIVRLRIEGKVLNRDSDDVIRVITFSGFGKSVDIQPPG